MIAQVVVKSNYHMITTTMAPVFNQDYTRPGYNLNSACPNMAIKLGVSRVSGNLYFWGPKSVLN